MTSVYTAGTDGRCTVCQRPEAEHAPEAWTADARACPPAEFAIPAEWPPGGVWSADGDHVPRTVMPTAPHVEVTAETVTDEQIVLRAAPATWDGLRCFEARALLRLATAEGDAVLAAHCSRGIKIGCLAKDSLRFIADAINARAKGGR